MKIVTSLSIHFNLELYNYIHVSYYIYDKNLKFFIKYPIIFLCSVQNTNYTD